MNKKQEEIKPRRIEDALSSKARADRYGDRQERAMTNQKDRLQEFTSLLSYKLGRYTAEGLFKNYPQNFNEQIPKLAKELYTKSVKAIIEEIEKDVFYVDKAGYIAIKPNATKNWQALKRSIVGEQV